MSAYSRPDAPQPIDLRLDGNEGPRLDPASARRLLDVDCESIRSYPSTRTLEADIARRFAVEPERVLVTAGGDDALDRVFRVVGGPGREVIVPTPTFEMIERYVAASGATTIEVRWDEGAYPCDAVIDAVSEDTAAIVVVSPNNPTGLVATPEDLRRLAAAAPRALIVCDLAYAEFAEADLTRDALALQNGVVVRTFSKAWGLAGLRVGYALGDPGWITRLREVGAPYPCAGPSLACAEQRLRSAEAAVTGFVAATRERRPRLAERLRTAGCRVTASQANFVFARSPRARWIAEACATQGIAIRRFPGRAGLEDALRITCPRDGDEETRLGAALDTALLPEALLFDMDGVLVDVSSSYRRCILETAEAFGVRLEAQEVSAAKAAGDANDDWELTRRLLSARGVTATLSDVRAEFERRYQGEPGRPGLRRRERLLLEPGTLARLAARRPLAVVTGRPRRDAQDALDRFGIAEFFRCVVAREDADALKPDPAPVRVALERLSVRRAWMLGDTPDDVRAARGAGVVPLGVVAPGDDGPEGASHLMRAGAARVLETFEEIEELLP